MNEQTTHSKSVLGILRVLLVLTLLSMSASPSQAQWCWFGCWEPEPEPEPEPVEPTGVMHVVYMVGNGFMPDEIHAQLGDTVKFYQLAYTTQRVEATDNSWTSDYLYKGDSWQFMIDHDTGLNFEKKVSSWSWTDMTGRLLLEDIPSAVALGDLIDHNGQIIGKDGKPKGNAAGLGKTLAMVGGVVNNVGLGLGLNTDLGLGNN